MTREDEIRVRMEKATPGEWIFHDDWNREGVDVWLDGEHMIAEHLTMSDAKFVAYSKSDMDYLFNALDEANAATVAALKLLSQEKKENQRLSEALSEMLASRHYGYTQEQIERWYAALEPNETEVQK